MTSKTLAGLGLAAVCLAAAMAAPASAASPKFGLDYRVERADSGKLSLDACADTARKASVALGLQTALEKRHPGQLTVFASGPAGGGGSLMVYCISVDQKTAFLVQAIDYNRPDSPTAARWADRVHQALLTASGK